MAEMRQRCGKASSTTWLRGAFAALALSGLLAACGGATDSSDEAYPDDDNRGPGRSSYDTSEGGIFGPDGISILGGQSTPEGQGGPGIGVNTYLWRASLDTISFMPLASADPFGGVIITDWYSPPETPNERFKINLFILGRDLRADGVRAAVFRQRLNDAGSWVDQEVASNTSTDLEDAILTRARQLRIASIQ